MMKKVRDGVLVVQKVLLVGGADILADVLQLHEQQRQTVDEPDDIRPAAVEIAAHPQFPHTEEMIVFGIVKVEHPQPLSHPFALGIAKGDLYPVPDQVVLLAIGGGHGLRGGGRDDLADGIVIGRGGQSQIQFFDFCPQDAGQHHLTVRFPAQQAVRPEILVVVGVHRLPA